jgi:hypothetical protein
VSLADIQRRSCASATGGIRGSWPESQALDEAGISDLLGRHRYCVLATGRADGRAHAAPVAFVLLHEGEAFRRVFAPIRKAWLERHGGEPGWAVALAELRPERVFSYAG